MSPKKTAAYAASPWSDKGLGACARKAELTAIAAADAMYPRRCKRWQREVFLQFGMEFFRLTQPNALPGGSSVKP